MEVYHCLGKPSANVLCRDLSSEIKLFIMIINNFSLPICYEAEFKENMQVAENGVPLEHLISCLSCVELKQSMGSVKYLIWTGNKTHDNIHEGKFFSQL